jgi:CRISPR-associated protein Cmr1
MEIRIRTLTPLWTGGMDSTMDRVHETGILGSLRWWYEAIIRALKGKACDPTERKCNFDAEKYRKSKATDERHRLRDAGLCDVCQLFGATGWRRRFRLEVVDETQWIWDQRDQMLNIRPPQRARGWFLPPGKMGKLTIRLESDRQALSSIAASFLFLERWGSIGARPQLGYGVFRIENRDEVLACAKGWEWEIFEGEESSRVENALQEKDVPDLRRFGFFRYSFQSDKPGWWTRVPGISRVAIQVQSLVSRFRVVPLAPSLKNEWRFNRWQRAWGDDRQIFGTLRPTRRRSRVAVSWAYKVEGNKWEIRGWVWLPTRSQTAECLWEVLSNGETWRQVVGVAGDLQTQRLRTEQDVLQLLRGCVP